MKKKIISALLLFSLVVLSCGCNESYVEEVKEKETYNVEVDYIGSNFVQSEQVTGVTVYQTLADYNLSAIQQKIVWIEESALNGVYADAEELISAKSAVIIIADNTDKKTLLSNVYGIEMKDVPTTEFEFTGLLFTNICSTQKDAVALYSKNGKKITDYLAFATTYDYLHTYQGNELATSTDVFNMKKYADYFNVFNFEDNAYAVSLVTMIDYLNNPGVVSGEYQFQFTLANFTEVVPNGYLTSTLNNKIDAGKNSWNINLAPSGETKISADDTTKTWNFLYNRFFEMCNNGKRNYIVEALTRGTGMQSLEWKIEFYDDEFKNELKTNDNISLMSCADILNPTGHYKPSCGASFVLYDADGNKKTYSFNVALDEWAIVWGDDYDEDLY